MSDFSAVKKIFKNIDVLIDGYHDFPETQEADLRLEQYLKDNYLSSDEKEAQEQWLKLSSEINHAEARSEQQGFIYGFRYAVELLMKGGL